ncbi:MAG TPA: hypothetical protein VJZ76_04450 [Thermoanaerobaculia bacterium]|nr:hypothetical protein [Thermoanaerobaculia bacterium]
MRHPLFAVLLAVAVLVAAGCRKKDQPAETGTLGNATDRNPANGTTGTGEPASVGTDTANAAQQLGTAGTVALTGTTEVHGASTQTTSTISGPNTTTHSVATPTETTATVVTTAGATTTAKTKKQ